MPSLVHSMLSWKQCDIAGCSVQWEGGEHLLGLVLLQAILVMAAFQMLQLVLVFFISCE